MLLHSEHLYQLPIIFTMTNKVSSRLWNPLSLPTYSQTQFINIKTASLILYHFQCADPRDLALLLLQSQVFAMCFLDFLPLPNSMLKWCTKYNALSIPSNIWNISYPLVSFVVVRITVLFCNLMISVFSPHSWSLSQSSPHWISSGYAGMVDGGGVVNLYLWKKAQRRGKHRGKNPAKPSYSIVLRVLLPPSSCYLLC